MKFQKLNLLRRILGCIFLAAGFLFLFRAVPDLTGAPEKEYCFFSASPQEAQRIAATAGGKVLWWEGGICVMKATRPETMDTRMYTDSWLFSETGQETISTLPDESAEATEETFPLDSREWHLPAIQAQEAWTYSQGQGVLIAVIDTGIAPNHPEFQHSLLRAETIIPESAYAEGGYFQPAYQGPEDYLGHGTHVAGLIAAAADGTGSTGAAPKAKLLSIKALESDGVRGNGKTSWVAAAIGRAVDAGADIINLSIGGAMQENDLLWESIRRANEHGVLVVCAAGNTGTSAKSYPAAYPETIAVSAVRRQLDSYVIASYSNYGDWIDICAPGSNLFGPSPDGSYSIMTGTSMACPLISSGAALLLSRDPALTPAQLRSLLFQAAEDLGPEGKDDRYGAGLLNLNRTMALLEEKSRLLPPVSDCPGGSVLTEETTVNWRTDTLHSTLHYTLDGTDPSQDSPLWPAGGRCLPVGSIRLKLAVCRGQETGEIQTIDYTVIPAQETLLGDQGTEVCLLPTYGPPEKRLEIEIPSGEQFKATRKDGGQTGQMGLYDQNGTLLATEKKGTLSYKNKTRTPITAILKVTSQDAAQFTLEWTCRKPPAPAPTPTQAPTATTAPPETTAPTVPVTVPETTEATETAPPETPPETETEEPLFQIEVVTNETTLPQIETTEAVATQPDAPERSHRFILPALAAGLIFMGISRILARSRENRRKDDA